MHCPTCVRQSHFIEAIKTDPKSGQKWLVTFCSTCKHIVQSDFFEDSGNPIQPKPTKKVSPPKGLYKWHPYGPW